MRAAAGRVTDINAFRSRMRITKSERVEYRYRYTAHVEGSLGIPTASTNSTGGAS